MLELPRAFIQIWYYTTVSIQEEITDLDPHSPERVAGAWNSVLHAKATYDLQYNAIAFGVGEETSVCCSFRTD